MKTLIAIIIAVSITAPGFSAEQRPAPKPDSSLLACSCAILALGAGTLAVMAILRMCDNIPSPSYPPPSNILTNLPPASTNSPATNHLARAACESESQRVVGYLTFDRGFDPGIGIPLTVESSGPCMDFERKATFVLGADGVVHMPDGTIIEPIRCDRPDGVFYIFDLRTVVPINDGASRFFRIGVNQ